MSAEITPEFHEALKTKAKWMADPAGREVNTITERDALEISKRFAQPLGTVYREALQLSICPCRYLRNRESISLPDQLTLASAKVSVIGAGGLGGNILHLLARSGVGHIVIVDCDLFDETNLNRQLFCTSESLGKPKALVAAQQIGLINPAVETTPHVLRIDRSNLPGILAGAKAAVDALDNIRDRLLLENAAKQLSIPLVHGALAGFDGQVMTVFPDDAGLAVIYGKGEEGGKNPNAPEAIMGVPALMPSMIATIQAMEVVKILLGRGSLLRHTLLHVGLEEDEMNRFAVG